MYSSFQNKGKFAEVDYEIHLINFRYKLFFEITKFLAKYDENEKYFFSDFILEFSATMGTIKKFCGRYRRILIAFSE